MSRMARARVVHYCPTGPVSRGWVGGLDVVVLQILAGLDRGRYDVSALVNHEGWFKDQCDRGGIECRYIPRGARLSPGFILKFAAHLRSAKPDLFHTHGLNAGAFYGYVAARLAEVPRIILTIHTYSHEEPALSPAAGFVRDLLDRWVVRGVDFAYTVSYAQLRDPMLRAIPQGKLAGVPNGIEVTPLLAPTGAEVRDELGIGRDELIAITVARLVRQKGIEYLLEAVPKVARSRPDVRFLIVGDGELKEELLERKQALAIGERAIFAGFRTDVPRLLAGSDLFVLPSLFEGMPIAVLESMRAGLPTVATDIDGTPELVGDTALLVPPARPDMLADAIVRITSDREWMRELGRRARKRIEEHFSVEGMVRKVAEIYERVLSRDHA
jgi:glycosyltransferase involved in cell wall biosynthesis